MTEPEQRETSQEPIAPDPAPPQATTDRIGSAGEGDDGYRLAEPAPAGASPPESPAVDPGTTESTFQAAPGVADEERTADEVPCDVPAVHEVWSRWVEWKEPLLWSAAGIGLAGLILYEGTWIAALLFSLGVAYGMYHIVISLEIPVRVTPEQAVQEFYGALGHRLPNYRRMFALLTADGKRSTEFTDFAGFRAYWRRQAARLYSGYVWLSPLDFRVEGFKCRYNPERTLANVRYKLQVFPRRRAASDEPLAEFDRRNLLVKGPDGQWYLNDGTLPEPG